MLRSPALWMTARLGFRLPKQARGDDVAATMVRGKKRVNAQREMPRRFRARPHGAASSSAGYVQISLKVGW